MTTLAATLGPSSAPRRDGNRVLLPNVSWSAYTGLLTDLDGSARLTYDHGWLEIEMPGWLHEMIARFVGEMVTATLKRQRTTYIPGGATTGDGLARPAAWGRTSATTPRARR